MSNFKCQISNIFPLPGERIKARGNIWMNRLSLKSFKKLFHLSLPSPQGEEKVAGFTLLELLIVIAIMATVSVVGLASFTSYSNSQKLSIAVLDVKNMVQYAKSQAASQGGTCQVGQQFVGYKFLACCQGGTCPLCLSNNNYEVDIVCSGGSAFVKGSNLPQGVTVDTKNSTSFSYQFNALSGMVTGPGSIVLLQGNTPKNIVISATGVIQ